MWPDRYSRQQASLIQVSGIVKLLLSRGQERLNRTLSRSSAVCRDGIVILRLVRTGLKQFFSLRILHLDFH